MVEKIIISPESIRGLGNIVMPKTGADFRSVDCTVLVGTDTVNDETVTVFTLESSVTLLSVVLSVDDSSVVVGDTVTLSATVTDEMTQPVEGATVSFKLNGNVLGTADTNSSGVATYSYTTVSDGTLVFSSVCSDNSSNSVNVTVTGHNYSLEFDSSDYTVVGGSVVIKVSLTDNSTVVPNVSVGLSGGGSSWSATTDTDGVATFNLSNITTGGTYTASYGGATATANVTIQTYLFKDDCTSSSGLSNYGSLHKLRVNNVDGTLSYDSGMNAYKITTTTANADGLSDFPIPALDNKNNYYIEAEFYTTDTSTGGQPGLVVYPTNDTGGNGVMWRDIAQINRCGVLPFSNYNYGTEVGNAQKSALPVANNWIRVRLEVNGTSVKGIWLKTDGTEVYSYTYTVPYTSGAMRVGLAAMLKSTTKPYYIRNIKAEYL